MTKVIERHRISDEVKANKRAATPHERVVLQEAKQIAQGLIKLPEVLEVAIFGKRRNKEGGYNLHLLLEVSDKKLYRRFIVSLRKFTEHNKTKWNRNYSDAALRLMALSSVWNTHSPEWRTFFALNGGDIHLDACVVPENYHNRLAQLADDIPHRKPEFIRSFADAEVLAAKRFEL